MERMLKAIVVLSAMVSLSACVTQNYEENEKPVVENDSSNSEIALTRISLGLGYLKMGNTTQAKYNLEKAKSFAPNSVEVYTAFAHYYETVGEDEQTIQSYEKALSIKPDDANTLNNYGVYLCRKERLDDAEKQFLRAINVPTYLRVSESYENLAFCQLGALNFEKAEVYLDKAIDHSPSNSSALYQMMRLQYAIGEYKTAKLYSKRYEKAARRFNAEFLALAYKIYTKLGETKIASNYGNMLVKMHPQSWYAKQFILNSLESIDVDDLAEKYRILVQSRNPNTKNKKVVVLSPSKKAPILLSRNKPTQQVTRRSPRPSSQSSDNLARPKINVTQKSSQSAPKNTVVMNQASEATITAAVPKKQGKRTVVLKAPKRANATDSSTKAVVASKEMTVDEQLKALETITQETAQLERQSTDDLMDRITESSAQVDDELDQEALTETSTGDDSIDAILAEAEALLDEGELEENLIVEQQQKAEPTGYTEQEASTRLVETETETETEMLVTNLKTSESEDNSFVETPPSETRDLPAAQVVVNNTDILNETLADLTQEHVILEDEDENLSNSEQPDSNVQPVSIQKQVESPDSSEVVYYSLDELPKHTIVENENLFTVSKRYNIHLHALRQWNNLDDKSLLRIGDTLYLADPSLIVVGNNQ